MASKILGGLLVVALAGCAVVGLQWKSTADQRDSARRERDAAAADLAANVEIIRTAALDPAYRPVLQETANRECPGGNAVLFNPATSLATTADGATKTFAVLQYVCNDGSLVFEGQIRFVVAQSLDQSAWELTYGSSVDEPALLPGYVYDTDPALFDRRYNFPPHR